MKKKLLISFILVFAFFLGISISSYAKELDEIQDYEIKVDVREDGTLDMVYHIEWKVLDSTSEGPLEWVKIGVPNRKIDEIRALSDTINSIRLYESGGTYIRVDFDREYVANEVINFDFSFHQSYMYTINGNKCTYSFTPGWFNDIRVKNLTIKWNSNKQIYNNSNSKKNGEYLVWNYSLAKGEKVTAKIEYNSNSFTLDENKQFKNANAVDKKVLSFAFKIIFAIIIISVILSVLRPRSYYVRRGYGMPPPHHHHHHHGPRGGCACASSCASSCACACACAGGGRAGCSKKDFYGTNLRIKVK